MECFCPRGTLVIELSVQYSHYSRHRIPISGFTLLEVIAIGEIAVSDIKRDLVQGALTARYGITPMFEAELKVPFLYRSDREVKGPGTADVSERTINDYGLGDIEGALFYHIITGKGYVPDIILNFRTKSYTGRDPYHLKKDSQNRLKDLPTGNGHLGFSGGFTAVKASDPAVFFLSLGYFWNVERDIGRIYGKVDPGDSVEYSIGVGYALSEKFSLSTTYQQRFTTRTKQNGKKVPGSFINASTLFIGGSYALSKKTHLNLSVGVGLTTDVPDVQVTLSIPFRTSIL